MRGEYPLVRRNNKRETSSENKQLGINFEYFEAIPFAYLYA